MKATKLKNLHPGDFVIWEGWIEHDGFRTLEKGTGTIVCVSLGVGIRAGPKCTVLVSDSSVNVSLFVSLGEEDFFGHSFQVISRTEQ